MTTETYKYEKIANDILHLIKSGAFRPGNQIPSVRETSRQRGVSVSTVMQAYYLLEAQGWIEARQRSGFYVSATLPSELPEPETSSPITDPVQVSMRDLVSRVALRDSNNPNLIPLGAAQPDPELSATA